ncbi:MAG: phosphatidylserine decarboxylase family protein [Chthoniobacterales bacterium]
MRWQTLWQAKWILLILVVATAAAWSFAPWLILVVVAALLFTLYFFRDPHRRIPAGPDLVVSPADGRVTDIEMMEETEVTGQTMRRVGIFLSVFDVHVNRMPADGRVVYTAGHDGTYHDARSPMASTHNAARTWGFDCSGTVLVVRQITGAIARRIVPWALLGDRLRRGQHFGMIRFGSRTEIYLPLDAEVSVTIGQHVRGGSTVIGRLTAAKHPAPQRHEEVAA